MAQGVCTNSPEQCGKAASREPLAMTDAEAPCPECGGPLGEIKAPEAPAASALPRGWLTIGLPALCALIALMAGVMAFGPRLGLWSAGPTAPADSVTASEWLDLAGTNAMGSTLAPALVTAWLHARGARDIIVEQQPAADGLRVDARVITATIGKTTVSATIRAQGVAPGFADLAGSAADIAMAERRIRPDEGRSGDLEGRFTETLVGYEAIAIVVAPGRGTQSLTMAQLGDLFAGRITNWSQAGGPAGPVHLYARESGSGVYDAFEPLILRGRALGAARRFGGDASLEAAVAGDPGGIGFVAAGHAGTAKTLAVGAGSGAAAPTAAAVRLLRYPLVRPLYLYSAVRPRHPGAKAFTAFVVSPAGQAVVEQEGFIPLAG